MDSDQGSTHAGAEPGRPRRPTAEASRLHREAVVVDGHNDLAFKLRAPSASADIARPQPSLHTDIPRLRAGGVDVQFWSAYVPVETLASGGAARYALEQIDLIHRMVEANSDFLEMAFAAADIDPILAAGRIACLIGVEGGHAIENSLGVLRSLHRLGARYLTLAHGDTLDWVDSATDEPRHGGLSAFGEQVVREMNRLGMLVDMSHVSADAMRHVLRVSRAPVIASHSSAYALVAHPRNVPDDVLRQMPANGGVVMVNFFSGFIDSEAARVVQHLASAVRRLRNTCGDPETLHAAMEQLRRNHAIPRGTLAAVVDHIDHVAGVAGIDHVGLGSDYDGISHVPVGLEDVSCFPNITQELLYRGYAAGDIRKILGENVLRVLRMAEDAANAAANDVAHAAAKNAADDAG